jgi:hypothetical protein
MEDTSLRWRKSTYSNGGENCVEVGRDSMIMIRDTTNRDGVTLGVTIEAWRQLLNEVRAGIA